jgi:hypothetical protein
MGFLKESNISCPRAVFQQDFNQGAPLFFGANAFLECGSERYKVFECDQPTELNVTITLRELSAASNGCDLKVWVELKDSKDLEFEIKSPSVDATIFEQNSISFYSKKIKKITIQCQGGGTSGCLVTWSMFFPLRETDKNSRCPVDIVQGFSGGYTLQCGEKAILFKSDQPTELAYSIGLTRLTQVESCDLKVTVKLENEEDLSFLIPIPSLLNFNNSIHFYSKNVRAVSIECKSESGVGDSCRGSYNGQLILRGHENEGHGDGSYVS